MAIPNYLVSLLVAMALLATAALASANEPGRVVVKGKHDPSEVVIEGVRDPSPWFRIESQHLIVYSDSDPEQVIELVNNLERLDYVLRMYLKPFLIAQADPPRLTLYFQDRFDWAPGLGELPVETVGGPGPRLAGRCGRRVSSLQYAGEERARSGQRGMGRAMARIT